MLVAVFVAVFVVCVVAVVVVVIVIVVVDLVLVVVLVAVVASSSSALRVLPAGTRLTVHRRFAIALAELWINSGSTDSYSRSIFY